MLGRKTGLYWKFCWAVLIPVVLIGVFIYTTAKATPLNHGSYTFGPIAIGQFIFSGHFIFTGRIEK